MLRYQNYAFSVKKKSINLVLEKQFLVPTQHVFQTLIIQHTSLPTEMSSSVQCVGKPIRQY